MLLALQIKTLSEEEVRGLVLGALIVGHRCWSALPSFAGRYRSEIEANREWIKDKLLESRFFDAVIVDWIMEHLTADLDD